MVGIIYTEKEINIWQPYFQLTPIIALSQQIGNDIFARWQHLAVDNFDVLQIMIRNEENLMTKHWWLTMK